MTVDDNSYLEKQDRKAAFKSVYQENPDKVYIVLEFLEEKLFDIAKRYGVRITREILTDLAKILHTGDDLTSLARIKIDINTKAEGRTRGLLKPAEDVLKTIQGNMEWYAKKLPQLQQWLETNVKYTVY